MYCGLFVVLFTNLYCKKRDVNKGKRGSQTPANRKAAAAAAKEQQRASGGLASTACATGVFGSTYNPALDVGDAAGLFHGHQDYEPEQDEEESSSSSGAANDLSEQGEMQSPQRRGRKKRTSKGPSSSALFNVCAVEEVEPPVLRRSLRKRK